VGPAAPVLAQHISQRERPPRVHSATIA
jgi:hypothetical protein